MSLLQSVDGTGLPDECLLARLRGRRTALVGEWSPWLTGRQEPPAAAAQAAEDADLRWVYRHLAPARRAGLLPYFIDRQLPLLRLALRRKAAGTEVATAQDGDNILGKKFLAALAAAADLPAAAGQVEAALSPLSPRCRGVAALAATDLRGFESELAGRFLEDAAETRCRSLREYFQSRLDLLNLVRLAKGLRWGERPARWLEGGTVAPRILSALAARRDWTGLVRLVERRSGLSPAPQPPAVQQALERGLGLRLRRLARDPLDTAAVVLDYFWRRRAETVNFRTLAAFPSEERRELASEMLR